MIYYPKISILIPSIQTISTYLKHLIIYQHSICKKTNKPPGNWHFTHFCRACLFKHIIFQHLHLQGPGLIITSHIKYHISWNPNISWILLGSAGYHQPCGAAMTLNIPFKTYSHSKYLDTTHKHQIKKTSLCKSIHMTDISSIAQNISPFIRKGRYIMKWSFSQNTHIHPVAHLHTFYRAQHLLTTFIHQYSVRPQQNNLIIVSTCMTQIHTKTHSDQ